jgi:S-adenosylmethionine:tRNA ribosyltransferase-isomerase
MLKDYKGIEIEDYAYELPEERIARYPLEHREDARLLVYEEGEIRDSGFRELPALLGAGDTLVFNNTRVIHARLMFRKRSGAAIEILCLEPAYPVDHALNLATLTCCEWYCMVGNLKKWKDKDGVIMCRYTRSGGGGGRWLRASRVDARGTDLRVRFEWDAGASFGEVLEECGQVPIPPYLNREPEESDETRYQTVYSKSDGSVAAPTAGLHFTKELLQQVRDAGADLRELTLHVGAGTFKPVKSEKIGEHEMHSESIFITRPLVERLIEAPRVIAVGTTTARALESLYWIGVKAMYGMPAFNEITQWEVYYTLPAYHPPREVFQALLRWFDEAGTVRLQARSTLMIVPGYTFRVVSGMFTNFHQPRSTLLLLVAAAIGEGWRRVYDHALANDYRFLSYGDGSLLWVGRDHRV